MSVSVLILTGQSGSGKSTAIHALEDHGYFCVDNIPTGLVERLIALVRDEAAVERLAVVMDVREPHFIEQAPQLVARLRKQGESVRVVYLEAGEAALIRRYSETRRRHPLDSGTGLRDAIVRERDVLVPMRELADDTLDTSMMSPHELRARVTEQIVGVDPGGELKVALVSFGFKHGLPLEADMVLDVRFLPNPYFEPNLREQSGLDAQVAAYVTHNEAGAALLQRVDDLLGFLLPRYQREGRRYFTVAIGCTGGQHRSVAVAGALGKSLARRGLAVDLRHRDLRGPK